MMFESNDLCDDNATLAAVDSRAGNNGLLEEDLECGCCYSIMVEPTTLNCGHSFCRYCLARWWKASRQKTCPECIQPWVGFPSVNVLLRNAINRLFPHEEMLRREELEEDFEYQTTLQRFEEFGQKAKARYEKSSADDQALNFYKICIFFLVAILLLIVLIVLIHAVWISDESLALKPVKHWTREDVAAWIRTLGPWTEQEYSSKFFQAGINGKLLLSMTEDDLESYLDIHLPLHLRTIKSAVDVLRVYGIKPPTDFFEYKAVYRSKSMFLLFGLREFPRATMIYTFLFDYENLFVPLLQNTSDLTEEDKDSIPALDILRCFLRIILFPYYLIGKFSWQWMNVNFWTTRVIFLTSVLMSMAEIIQIRWLLTGGWRTLHKSFIKYSFLVMGNSLFHRLLWPILPGFVADLIFYWLLYLSPLDGIHKLRQALNNSNQAGGAQLLTMLWRWLWGRRGIVLGAFNRLW